ncbi:MAG: hypothetical protein ABFD12_01540 [Syntrophorhabdus sp.]
MNKKTKVFLSLFFVSIFLLGIYIGAYGKGRPKVRRARRYTSI